MSDAMSYLKTNDPSELQLSSNQIFTLFDRLIYTAIDCLVDNTEFIDRALSSVMSWYNENKRRRLSRLPRQEAVSLMMSYMLTDNTTTKKDILKKLMLERGLMLGILQQFLEVTKDYQSAVHRTINYNPKTYVKASRTVIDVERQVGVLAVGNLYCAINTVRLWNDVSIQMRDKILKKHTRYIFSKVRYEANRSTTPLSMDDMAHNYVVALLKAIHKYLPEKGTFQSYLDYWLMDAKTNSSSRHYYGLAFDVPNMDALEKNNITNLSISLSAEEVQEVSTNSIEQDVVESAHILRVRELAIYADPLGYARSAMNID
ncbi:Sigma70_r2 domain-containing protein [Vibrio phage vB_VcorM_GR11A]|nr:Sigma70_r2 domain-containing protein [Vibrio phage vB_VcorM_GR11A]